MKNLGNTNIQAKLNDWQYLLDTNTYRVDINVNTDLEMSDFFNISFSFKLTNDSTGDILYHSVDVGEGVFLVYNLDNSGTGLMEIKVPDLDVGYSIQIAARLVLDTGESKLVEFPYLDLEGVLQTDSRLEKTFETMVIQSSSLNLVKNSWS